MNPYETNALLSQYLLLHLAKPAELPLAEVQRLGIHWIPQTLDEALDAFEADQVVRSALAPQLADEFVRVKRKKWVRYNNHVGEWELEQYLTLF